MQIGGTVLGKRGSSNNINNRSTGRLRLSSSDAAASSSSAATASPQLLRSKSVVSDQFNITETKKILAICTEKVISNSVLNEQNIQLPELIRQRQLSNTTVSANIASNLILNNVKLNAISKDDLEEGGRIYNLQLFRVATRTVGLNIVQYTDINKNVLLVDMENIVDKILQ
jgi:hypothetical protein